MTIKVNPPPQIRRPKKLSADRDIDSYFRQLEWVLFQLWERSGGGNDDIADAQEPIVATAFVQLKELSDRVGSGDALTSDCDLFTVDSDKFYCDQTEA